MNSKTSMEGITSNAGNARNQSRGWQNLALVCSLWSFHVAPQTKNQNNCTTSTSTGTSKATNSNQGLQFCGDHMFGDE